MFLFNVVFVACAILFTCEAAFVDTLPKCSIKDDDCVRSLYEGVIHGIGKDGIKELNIPPIDPLHLTNISITVMDAIKVTVIEGVIKGISKCVINKYRIDIENQKSIQEVVCDLSVKGQIAVAGQNEAFRNILGTATVNSQGKGKVKIEKLTLNVAFPFRPFKKEDGEIYFRSVPKDAEVKYEIEKVTFAAEKIFIGNNDISPIVVSYLNDNWRSLLKSFGSVFVDRALKFYVDFSKRFFQGVPAKIYIIEDLSSYVKN